MQNTGLIKANLIGFELDIEMYSELSQTSMIIFFAKIVGGWTISVKISILDLLVGWIRTK